MTTERYEELDQIAQIVFKREEIVGKAFLSKQRLNMVIDDASGLIVAFSPTWLVKMKTTAEAFKGSHFLKHLHPDHLPLSESFWNYRDMFKDMDEVNGAMPHIDRWVATDGSIVYVKWTGTWISDDGSFWVCNAAQSTEEEFNEQGDKEVPSWNG